MAIKVGQKINLISNDEDSSNFSEDDFVIDEVVINEEITTKFQEYYWTPKNTDKTSYCLQLKINNNSGEDESSPIARTLVIYKRENDNANFSQWEKIDSYTISPGENNISIICSASKSDKIYFIYTKTEDTWLNVNDTVQIDKASSTYTELVDLLANVSNVKHIGLQGKRDSIFSINDGSTMVIGRSGIYEPISDDFEITSVKVPANNFYILDYYYEG